jgi:hypothetical protein
MFYKDTTQKEIAEGSWDEKSCVTRQGGFTINTSNLPTSLRYIAKGAVISIAGGIANLLKSAKVAEAAAKGATAIKIEKGSAIVVGDTIAGAKVSAIAEGETYDTLSVDATSAALKIGDVIAEEISGTLGLAYSTTAVKGTPDIAVTLVAYEIDEASLPYPINDEIKEALTVRHAFKI